MPTTPSTTSTTSLSASLFCRPTAPPPASRRNFSCQVALATDISDAIADEEADAAAKIGARIRVKAPVRIHHVMKAPELDLCGLEGVIKQYVGVWKGKRISANLPFKVEFFVPVEGQEKAVKFVAHLREEEFEYLTVSD